MSLPDPVQPAISPGTQVVLRAAKQLPGGAGSIPAGSVGEVVEAPASIDRAYLVRFADGRTLRVKHGELAVRRRTVDDELGLHGESLVTPGEDVRPFVIYQVELGSRAYGLATDLSDHDLRGVYLPPADRTWSLWKPPPQWESTGEAGDEVYWELERFLVLALKANPSLLETLWAPTVLRADALGRELRDLRGAFLSRHLFETYSGYVLSQFRRLRNALGKTGEFKAKHAMHLVRLLLSGIHAAEKGELAVDVSAHRDLLLPIRRGERTFAEVEKLALGLEDRFRKAFAKTRLPERPDYQRANAFLLRARRSRAGE